MSETERLAKSLEAGDRSGMWYPSMEAAAELRRLSAELEECQAQRRAAFRRIEEQDAELEKVCKISDSQALEIFNDLEKFMDQIEDEEVTDEYIAGQSLWFILNRVSAMKGAQNNG